MFPALHAEHNEPRRMWRICFVLFLAFMIPVTPLLGQIQEDKALAVAGGWSAKIEDCSGRQTFTRTELAMFLMEGLGVGTGAACSDGRRDADLQESGVLWFILGLVTMPYGVVAAYLVSPSPDAAPLKGKTASYVSSYTECYKETAKGIHTKWAWLGFGTAAVVGLIVLVAILLSPHTGKWGD